MSQVIFTKEMLNQLLRKKWCERGFSLADNERVGVSVDELVAYSAEHNAQRELPYVDLWAGILDECISWFISLHSVVYAERLPGRSLSDFEKATMLILSKLIADSTAMRHLVLLGFDSSARTLLRSISEYIEVLVAILNRPPFANEFLATDTPEAAQQFWQKHLRGGKIRRKVEEAWTEFFRVEKGRTAAWFANWGRGSNAIPSGTAHPSSAGGIFAAIPLKTKYTEENWLGIWGDKADASVETIFIYTQFAFPILLLSRDFPFEGYESYIRRAYDETSATHRHVRIGRNVLASVILSAGSDENLPHVYPELDWSIFDAGPEDESFPSHDEILAS